MGKIAMIAALCLLCMFPAAASGAQSDNCKFLDGIFHGHVKQSGEICQVAVPRKLPLLLMGTKVAPEMADIEFGANFEPAGGKTALIGEFALLPEEVNPVIDALRKGGVEVSAIHNHMIGEQPRLLFLHFQSVGELGALANTVKSAIEAAGKATRPE
ncbi:DUF1259 domain-containing protein [Paenibacillus thalictri]|uniref:DUF1259 domain-containing protein n=1 Tax=Paenibacillus thalictri TaxID=2527873 RepID=A0A4Q9DRK3_9BACL|nr:DUF1259 domain-containing protein [Paenibacillus thalictri]TBL77670.1 DUF1259 domain-containing protein [Paenibacillus thalictri]